MTNPGSEIRDVVAAPVTLTIDIESMLKSRDFMPQGFDEDGEPYGGKGLVQLVAATLADRLKGDIQKVVTDAVLTEARAQVGAIVTDVIEGTVQITNGFGEPTGKTTTLRERIVKEAQEFLTRLVDSNGSYDRYGGRDSVPYTTYIARAAAKSALNQELKEAAAQAVADVKKQVTDIVSAEIGAKVAAAVTRGAL